MIRVRIVLLVAVLACPGAWSQEPEPENWLEALQEKDNAAFPDSLFRFDQIRADSVLAVFDSLGLKAYERKLDAARPWLQWDVDLTNLGGYNRVGGSAPGLSLDFDFGRSRRVELMLKGGYSFATEKVRYLGRSVVRLGKRSPWSVHGWYQDLVQPFGSNRVAVNDLRALVGGADDQDYLRRVGGGAHLQWGRRAGPRVWMGVSSHSERSMGVHRRFAILGELPGINPGITGGDNAQVFGGFRWGDLLEGQHRGSISHQVSGGALGGDLQYSRTDFDVTAREYVVGDQEVVLSLKGVSAGGSIPIQYMADVGGLSTVRGYPRRTLVGESSVATRLEWLVPYDFLRAMQVPVLGRMRFQFVPWADAARVWEGTSEAWLTSLGIGIQSYIGPFPKASQLRLDIAFPTGASRPHDVGLYVYFSPGDF